MNAGTVGPGTRPGAAALAEAARRTMSRRPADDTKFAHAVDATRVHFTASAGEPHQSTEETGSAGSVDAARMHSAANAAHRQIMTTTRSTGGISIIAVIAAASQSTEPAHSSTKAVQA